MYMYIYLFYYESGVRGRYIARCMVISCLLPVLYIEAVSGYVLGREASGIIIMIIQQRIRKVISEV